MIVEDYVSFETAKLLKEKGFDETCIGFYTPQKELNLTLLGETNSMWLDSSISAPTLQMAMKWLREIHGLYITITHRFSHNADNDVCFGYYVNIDTAQDGEWLTYEEACEEAIKYCLENLI